MTRTSALSDHVADAHVDGHQYQCGRPPVGVGVRRIPEHVRSPDEVLYVRSKSRR